METPSSSGEASMVETGLFRIPMTGDAPTIDGRMDAGEWEDSSALSGFWYWNYTATCHYDYMAPFETQLQVYAAYDAENLYMAFTSPVYPSGSWLRARGRFPDVIEHPLYGVYRDDYVGFGFRPYHDDVKSFRMGGFGWFINPINVVADYGPADGRKWNSDIVTRGNVTKTRWVQEMAIPLEHLRHGPYAGKDADGKPILTLPPPDGSTWCFRLDRCTGEWGNGGFHNKFSDTTSKLIFDSDCVSFQVNELGPVMEDIVNVRLTAKNHGDRSQTVRLGFFVESAAGTVYSSYADDQLEDGLLELVPGEVRKLRLRKPLPGINVNGNILWFDVRSNGRPARSIFRTKLIYFHSQDKPGFQKGHIERLASNRPPRKDFDVRTDYSYHTGRVSVVVDTGIYGASEEAQTATEAKVVVADMSDGERVIGQTTAPFRGPFACVLLDLPKLADGHTYKISTLLFDRNMRIVGEEHSTLDWAVKPYMNNTIGLDDVVWEPYVPLKALGPDETGRPGFETLKHRFRLDPSGLPAQIFIKPDVRELPLELRGEGAKVDTDTLVAVGRGPQFRRGYRVEAVVDGKRVQAEVIEPAKLAREGRSEFEYVSKLRAGPVDVKLHVRYDCDGAMAVRMTYGSSVPAEIDSLELVCDFRGPMDMTPGEGVEGVVWDSATENPELYYTHFVPWRRFGSSDRAVSWICRNERGWLLDRDGSAMRLERDAAGEVTWRVLFVNHTCDVQGERSIDFEILTHPSKPRPARARSHAWFYRGDIWAREYMMNVPLLPETIERMNRSILAEDPKFKPYEDAEDYLRRDAHVATSSPRGTPYDEMAARRKDDAPWNRYGVFRNGSVHKLMNREWLDKNVYYFNRQIAVGRRVGFWWDEYWPMHSQATWSDILAGGDAVLRDPGTVKEGELPWERGFLTTYLRRSMKRIARIYRRENMPNRQHVWAYDSASAFESFVWDIQLVEWAGSDHNSYELDSVVCYDTDRFRFFCQKWTGTIARVVPGYGGKRVRPYSGDDERFDRQYLGRALAHDIGAMFDGPHGTMIQPEEGVRLLNRLQEFGFFDERTTEFLPYWRNGSLVRYGPDFGDKEYTVMTVPPEKKMIVSVYRRPVEIEGGKGLQAIFVLMNESDEPVRADLHVLDAGRILGGPNDLTGEDVTRRWEEIDPAASALLADWSPPTDKPVLRDLESGRYVTRRSAGENTETYGPVYVPPHNYRVLYARRLTEVK